MIEVIIDSIRVSLTSPHRVVVLKDSVTERYLAIWIGTAEADAITMELQNVPKPRPLTHDLLKNIIHDLGGRLVNVLINDLRKDTYYARLLIEIDGKQIEVDSRPSDAIALAVREKAPMFVADHVMDDAGTKPERDIQYDTDVEDEPETREAPVDEGKLSAWADFVNTLDFEDFDDSED